MKAAKLELYAKTLEAAAVAQEDLQSRNGYGTVRRMDATVSRPARQHPGPKANAGPMTELMAALGLSSLHAVADALGESYENIRLINYRGKGVPARIQKKADALKAAAALPKK